MKKICCPGTMSEGMHHKKVFLIVYFLIVVGIVGTGYPQEAFAEEETTQQIQPDPDKQIHNNTAQTLGEIKNGTLDSLLRALKDHDPEVRANAATALGKTKDKKAVEPLIISLKDKEWEVRKNAVEALGEIRDGKAIIPVTALLQDKKSKVEVSAKEALAKIIYGIAEDHDIDQLIRTLQSQEKIVRQITVSAMIDLKEEDTIAPLIDSLNDRDPQVREDAAKALKNMGKVVVKPLLYTISEDLPMASSTISILGDLKESSAVESLIGVLKYFKDTKVRYAAVKALGEIGDTRSILPLIETLHDKDTRVREGAAEALRKMGQAVVAPLMTTLSGDNLHIRYFAIVLLGDLKNSRAVAPLIVILKNSESWALRFEAARALGKIKDPIAVGSLREALNDKDTYVREGVEAALQEITGKNF